MELFAEAIDVLNMQEMTASQVDAASILGMLGLQEGDDIPNEPPQSVAAGCKKIESDRWSRDKPL